MRIMGLDYGDKTVGVAISDETLLIAQPIETIKRERANKLRQTYARIEVLIQEYYIDRIVVGLPLNMDGTKSSRCLKTHEFAETLERRTGLEIVFYDERLTTFAADSILSEGGVRKEKRKEYIDKIAASMILQGYLDELNETVIDGGSL